MFYVLAALMTNITPPAQDPSISVAIEEISDMANVKASGTTQNVGSGATVQFVWQDNFGNTANSTGSVNSSGQFTTTVNLSSFLGTTITVVATVQGVSGQSAENTDQKPSVSTLTVSSKLYPVYTQESVSADFDFISATTRGTLNTTSIGIESLGLGYGMQSATIRSNLNTLAVEIENVQTGYGFSSAQITKQITYLNYTPEIENIQTGFGFTAAQITKQVNYLSTTSEVEKLSSSFAMTGATVDGIDAYFSNVKFLSFSDDSTFADKSSSALTVTNSGVSYQSSGSIAPKFSNGLGSYNGSSFLSANLASPIGTQDYTYECFAALRNVGNYQRFIAIGKSGYNMISIGVNQNSQNAVATLYLGQWIDIGVTAIELNTWYHFCLMRKNGVHYFFINGVLKGSSSVATSVGIDNTRIFVGANEQQINTSAESYLDGFVDSVRLTVGVARYDTTGFTAPQSKFPIK